MEEPLNPLEGPDPLDPLDDPLLDALERSIENPPGFGGPLAGEAEPYMDGLGSLLGSLETNIENARPIPTIPQRGGEDPWEAPDLPTDESGNPDPLLPEANDGLAEKADDAGIIAQGPIGPVTQDAMQRPMHPVSGPRQAPRGRGGGGRRAGGFPFGRRKPGTHTMAGTGSPTRVCPESKDLIDKEQCESCDKYRCWPDGTNEEPRECWYDWQRIQQFADSDEDIGEED